MTVEERNWVDDALARIEKYDFPSQSGRQKYARAIIYAIEIDELNGPNVWADATPPAAIHLYFVNGLRSVEFWVYARRFKAMQWEGKQTPIVTVWHGYVGDVVRQIMSWLYPSSSCYSEETMNLIAGEQWVKRS